MVSLRNLNRKYKRIGAKVGWQLRWLPKVAQHDGSRHVEVKDDLLHLVTTDRGVEVERLVFQSEAELLARVFIDMAFSAGVAHELKHRDATIDGRRTMHAHQLMLLDKLSSIWRVQAEAEIADQLTRYPYNDNRSVDNM